MWNLCITFFQCCLYQCHTQHYKRVKIEEQRECKSVWSWNWVSVVCLEEHGWPRAANEERELMREKQQHGNQRASISSLMLQISLSLSVSSRLFSSFFSPSESMQDKTQNVLPLYTEEPLAVTKNSCKKYSFLSFPLLPLAFLCTVDSKHLFYFYFL